MDDEEKIHEARSNLMRTFRPWFKIKVVDTLHPKQSAILTLFDLNMESFQDITEGDRIRIVNAQTSVSKYVGNSDSVYLNVCKTS